MKRSLQRHLSMTLSLAIIGAGIIASLVSFYFAYSEAEEFQDDTLRQVAALSVGSVSEARRLQAASRTISDPESRIDILRLPQDKLPPWLPKDIAPGLHTLDATGIEKAKRIFVREDNAGGRIVAIQSTESRDEIARNSAMRTLLPLLLLLPVLALLTPRIVRRELTPVRMLTESLDHQLPDQPRPLPEQDLPEEILPFVQAINRLLVRIHKMVSEQRRFIADAAHELRTPLTALSLQAQNVAQGETEAVMRERLVPLQSGIERARRLTTQLLDLARLQAGADHHGHVDMSLLARELIGEFLPQAERKGIDLGLQEEASFGLAVHPESLRLILRNGLENAIKYTPNGGEVTIRLSKTAEAATIEVIDNGPGIPEAELNQVFNAFYRARDAEGEGSGLGLAIAWEAANRLGGALQLINKANHAGLIFRYTQPV